MTKQQAGLGITNKRKQTNDIEKLTLREETMSKQAKTLNATELRRVLDYTAM